MPTPSNGASSPRIQGARALCAGVVAFVLLVSGRVQAEPSPPDRAIAERLYDQGRKQQAEGQHAAACESFAESLRLDPGTGILLNLAACHELVGRLASAWVEFREAVAALRRERRPDRMAYAQEHLSAIEPRLAYLTVAMPEGAEGDAPAVTLDGRTLGPAAWGVGIPVDAGWHEVVAQTASGAPWRATVNIHDGERRRVDVPPGLGDRRPPAASASVVGKDADVSAAPAAPGSSRRIAGLVVGGVGLATLAVGGYFGLRASSLWKERNRECPAENCTAEGLRLGERADSAATVATWTVGAGVVTVAAALVLLVPVWRSGAPPALAHALRGVAVDPRGRLLWEGTF